MVYDRRSDSITFVQEGSSTGALDMFDATDALVAALLDGLSGTHLLFGSLVIETDPPGAAVSVNGTEAGPAPLSLRGLPVGAVTLSARASGRETTETSVTIVDGETASASLKLARSMGTLAFNVPDDAAVVIRGIDLNEKTLQGSVSQQLPTGTYEAMANCPGLDTVREVIEVQRNATFRWSPWPKGYLVIQPNPPDAEVLVDGSDRGAAPLIVAVDPEVPHRVELRKSNYEPYLADVNAAAARKVSFRPVLAGKPGSIRVETTPAGATAYLDKDKTLTTPGTFEGVLPGAHTVSFDELSVDRRYYSSPGPVSVNVNPGEQSALSQRMVLVPATLTITDAPPDATVTADGAAVDRATVFTTGAEIPAGTLDVAVSTPAGQTWQKGVTSRPGVASTISVKLMTAKLMKRTIKLDGAVDDWEGVYPCWQPQSPKLAYPNQPGTQLTGAWICRDDQYIYWRMDFGNGTPSTTLTRSIEYRLAYAMRLFMGVDMITAELMFDRSAKTTTWIGISNSYTRTSSRIGEGLQWAIGSSTLELALPVSTIKKYIAGGFLNAEFDVATVNSSGTWLTTLASDGIYIDFR